MFVTIYTHLEVDKTEAIKVLDANSCQGGGKVISEGI
jgi:hypothetical protein